jgi:hypothetical protein
MTYSIMTCSIMTFSIMTFSIMTFSIMTFSIKGSFVTLSIGNTYITMLCQNAKCHYVEFRVLFITVLNEILLSVRMLGVIMSGVVAPAIDVNLHQKLSTNEQKYIISILNL